MKNISLHLQAGNFALLLGKNGAGKSTLLKIMAGLAKPTAGQISVKGRIGYLGHATFLYPALTARENLTFQARANQVNADIAASLEKVGLSSYAHEPVRHFSRGMAQRLNFARALMLQPDILLLDEPFTGMDGESTAMLKEELLAQRNAGAAIFMISHAPASDLPLATHVYELDKGHFKFSGTVSNWRPENITS